MHLLAAKPGGFVDDDGIVDLNQTPADIIILSAQDSSLGLLAEVADCLPADYPELRLANLVNLVKPAAYDLYEESVLRHAKLIVASVLGGRGYWEYGIDRLRQLSQQPDITLILLPGDDQPDPELTDLSQCDTTTVASLWRYLREGGRANTLNFYRMLHHLLAPDQLLQPIPPPRRFAECLIYAMDAEQTELTAWQANRDKTKPTAALVFYRAHVQTGNTDAFDEWITLLQPVFNVLPIALVSLKNRHCLQTVNHLLAATDCAIVINTTSFSNHVEGNAALSSSPQTPGSPLAREIPVIQAVMAASSRDDWLQSAHGLRPRDVAMNVALPELDGRIISRAVSFKDKTTHANRVQMDIIRYRLDAERAAFVRDLAAAWSALRRLPNADKNIALILANYPTRDGRLGNGVGLDTPASTLNILHALKAAGFTLGDIPDTGDALIQQLQRGVTNNLDLLPLKAWTITLDEHAYRAGFAALPESCQAAVTQRWGAPERDPKFHQGRFLLSGLLLGKVFIGIQPGRGFDLDLAANYHDPDLPPPHNYLAFYFWLRHQFKAHAIAHIGKHGNLEWLPGKGVGLGRACWPDALFGATPHLYPFIVNDPGEGAQAKRRAQAVILDHLMPPMARAETYGPMAELEAMMDEYYQALGLDPGREKLLLEKILGLTRESGIAAELPAAATAENAPNTPNDPADDAALLKKLDTYLCDIKESQIRHGLHCFGALPAACKLAATLVALVRMRRGEQEQDAGILHSLCADLNLRDGNGALFDPLQNQPAEPWQGDRPARLQQVCADPWRTNGDTRERLEQLAEQCMAARLAGESIADLATTARLLAHVEQIVMPALVACGENETGNFIRALEGRFIPAGPSGAPTRGRLDVLPTGRNFYSLDARSIPTPSAWELGQRSAQALIDRHLQEHGDYPRQLGISVWGTATMRTGGDDIAQALALMGVQPVWAEGSYRVIDVLVIPAVQLQRPRVDVTLRISGFFRDAFANVVRLFDTAVQALVDYEDPGDLNPIRHHMARDKQRLIENGVAATEAARQSRLRIFGAKPGSYGAGLQGLITQGIWDNAADLAKAYINWGGYAYSNDHFGQAAFQTFETRLGQLDAVVQNQDNREHDLLDSDDYYQFQGGMSNAVRVLSGRAPTIYHGDNANPSSPTIRTLKEELNRVIRARVVNPKWLAAMREHGYKGAFEMAASVDYVFAYDATTDLIADHQYEMVADAIVLEPHNRAFMAQANPHALKEAAERLLEAQQRGLWAEPGDYRDKLTTVILEIDASIETAGDG